VPPLISSRTFVAPSCPVSVCTTWASRASRLAASRPCTNLSPRSTVATPFSTETLRIGVPAGTYVRIPRCTSAAVGPASSARIASSAVLPERLTEISCSPWRNETATVAVGAAFAPTTPARAIAAVTRAIAAVASATALPQALRLVPPMISSVAGDRST
jgi:hypothetical protein